MVLRKEQKLAVEVLEPRLQLSATTFHLLALVYPTIQDGQTLITLSPSTLEALELGASVELPVLTDQLAGNQIEVRVHTEVIDRVIQMRPDGLAHDPEISQEISEFAQSGWYDHVLVLHGNRNVGVFDGGCCAFPLPGTTMSTIAVSPTSGTLSPGDVPGMLHEWMHALDHFYFDVNDVYDGTDPSGEALRLHGAKMFGYEASTEGRAEWSQWYSDYLTDGIRNLLAGGIETGQGLGPDAWVYGTPRQRVVQVPGSPLDRPDVSRNVTSLLSEVYWADATTEWGEIHRNATVDNNPIQIEGVPYTSGVGIHSKGEIDINLFGRTARFEAVIGIDDDPASEGGSVVFEVYGDGRLLYESGVVESDTHGIPISINTFAVNRLQLIVEDAGDGINNDHAVWANARFLPAEWVYLSELPWDSSSTGWQTIQLDKTLERNPLSVAGAFYGKGVGTHAYSEIVIDLGDQYTDFQSWVGVPEDVRNTGSIYFQVYLDGSLAWQSPLKKANDPATHLQLDVSGKQQMRLVVTDGGNGNNSDHAVWGAASLLPRSAVPDGDYNHDGTTNLADYTVWRNSLGANGAGLPADGTGDDLFGVPDGDVDAFDYQFWKANFGNTTTSVTPAGASQALSTRGLSSGELDAAWAMFQSPAVATATTHSPTLAATAEAVPTAQNEHLLLLNLVVKVTQDDPRERTFVKNEDEPAVPPVNEVLLELAFDGWE